MRPGALVRLLAATAALAAAAPVRADEGMVIWRSYDCGYFVLQMKGGYGLYEWLAGPYPNDGDVIEGELKSAGQHRVNNKTADLPTTIFQESFARKRDAITARIPAKCKDRPEDAPAAK